MDEKAHLGSVQFMGEDAAAYHMHVNLRRYELLTASEEVALAQSMEAGRAAAAQLAEYSELEQSHPNADELQAHVAEAGQARERMIGANLRLVVSVAKRYRGPGVDFAELLQDGNIGLITAVEKFDWRHGHKFSSYAMWWINQAVARSRTHQTRHFKLNSDSTSQLNRVVLAREQLIDSGGQPTVDNLAVATGLQQNRVKDLLTAMQGTQIASLDAPVGGSGDFSLGDTLTDPDSDSNYNRVEYNDLLRDLLGKLATELNEKEKYILTEKIKGRTFEDISATLEPPVSKQAVQQIMDKIRRRLKSKIRQGEWDLAGVIKPDQSGQS